MENDTSVHTDTGGAPNELLDSDGLLMQWQEITNCTDNEPREDSEKTDIDIAAAVPFSNDECTFDREPEESYEEKEGDGKVREKVRDDNNADKVLYHYVYEEEPIEPSSTVTTRASTGSAPSISINELSSTDGNGRDEWRHLQKRRCLDFLAMIKMVVPSWAAFMDSYRYHTQAIEGSSKQVALARYVIIFQQLMIYDKGVFSSKLDEEQKPAMLSEVPPCIFRHVTEQLDILRLSSDEEFGYACASAAPPKSNHSDWSPGSFLNKLRNVGAVEGKEADESKSVVPVKCVHLSDSGVEYQGQVKDNHLDGFGIYSFCDGTVYEGKWYRNQMHGYGKLAVPGGFIFEGEFRFNKQHGKGIFTEPNGRRFIGTWINGKLHGKVICIKRSKEVEYGQWENGNFVFWLQNGHTNEHLSYQNNSVGAHRKVVAIPYSAYEQYGCNYHNANGSMTKGQAALQQYYYNQQLKADMVARGPRGDAFALRQKELDIWERQARSLPHVPHINYNRVLGRWYARIRDPESGKRLWKGYTCSIHGFYKAREMAIERLNAQNKADIECSAMQQDLDDLDLPDSGIKELSKAGLQHEISISKKRHCKSRVYNRFLEGDGTMNDKSKPIPSISHQDYCSRHAQNSVSSNATYDEIKRHNEYLQNAPAEELLAASRNLEHVTGVYFNPKCRAWMAYYNQSSKGPKDVGKRRFIKQFLVSQSSFLEARETAIRKRYAWEAAYGAQVRGASAEAVPKKVGRKRKYSKSEDIEAQPCSRITSDDFCNQKDSQEGYDIFYKDEAKEGYSGSASPMEHTLEDGSKYGFECCSDSELVLEKSEPQDDVDPEGLHSYGDHAESYLNGSPLGDVHRKKLMHYFDREVSMEDDEYLASQKRERGLSIGTKGLKKKRLIPRDFVGVRHDQWGKGWRCVWSNEQGMQKSRFFGESKWGKETCKKKAEEFMYELIEKRRAAEEAKAAVTA